jgi:hypothetical protein
MELFGGEKYSKKAYDDAEKTVAFEEKALESHAKAGGYGHFYHLLDERIAEAKERMERLREKGKTEAIALNEEYDRLVAKAQEAVKKVEDFEREKLGMEGGE